jgi:hypothetical protein
MNSLPFGNTSPDFLRRMEEMDIRQYGSLDKARAYRERQREISKLAHAGRRTKKEERELKRQAELAAPGYIFIYRFKFDSQWHYKFSLTPLRSKRLELFRFIWVDGLKPFCKHLEKKFQSYRKGYSSYLLSKNMVWYLTEIEGKIPPLEQAGVITLPVVIQASEPRIKRIRSTKGYVYLLREINGLHFKIGCTRNPDSRRETFGIQLPYRVEYEHLIQVDDMYALEMNLHSRFADKRVNGEWFNLEPSDVDYIKGL